MYTPVIFGLDNIFQIMRDVDNGKENAMVEYYDLYNKGRNVKREPMKDQAKIFKRVTVFSDSFWHDCRRRRIYHETKIV